MQKGQILVRNWKCKSAFQMSWLKMCPHSRGTGEKDQNYIWEIRIFSEGASHGSTPGQELPGELPEKSRLLPEGSAGIAEQSQPLRTGAGGAGATGGVRDRDTEPRVSPGCPSSARGGTPVPSPTLHFPQECRQGNGSTWMNHFTPRKI